MAKVTAKHFSNIFLGALLQKSKRIQVKDRVLILRPTYVAGKYGIVCGRESNSNNQANQRWLIQVEDVNSSDILVSLILGEFILINSESTKPTFEPDF
ncbi:hypothetical protein LC613_31015 [Nostoc sphaeroides CHAB 2801]|uniref:hypothetical protein n=1 Tax=Nostoc sphaeroides TaxID=446679 RepID=UPI001E4E8563|nr:hypothetical protein [Nostoc sphaeroides]MCC5632102.1 hypothetical protein [Nostoc sphaeroides CHAB 2801]